MTESTDSAVTSGGGNNLLPGYSLGESLGEGDGISAYRAVRLADGLPVAVVITHNRASPQVIARLDRDYTLSRTLVSPGIARPMAMESTHSGYAVIYPAEGFVALSRFANMHPISLETFYQIAIQMTELVAQIHAESIVHKDINPGNFLIHPESRKMSITGFGIAATLSRGSTSSTSLVELEGTLAYIAPEQTGRTSRSIDHRSDFYALGVSFYELLTGQLPFANGDPAELVHQHLARSAEPAHKLAPGIPLPLSHLIAKLMAKEPEDRYQSSAGLLHDLESLQQNTAGQDFQLGQMDTSARLMIPERLYGRDQQLLAIRESIALLPGSRAQLINVMGLSGVGKSALIKEALLPLNNRPHYFVRGKFDQLKREKPYSALLQATEQLTSRMLTEPGVVVKQWRQSIENALGNNAQVILDVFPAFERLLGAQPAVVDLPPEESRYRFNLMFRRLLPAISNEEHPLIIFLDDLQWADSASLSLLQVALSDPDIRNVLFIGAYRDNEVPDDHALHRLLSELQSAGTPVKSIELLPLQKSSVTQLVADTLHIPAEEADSLSELVYNKTRGNPFFVRQFIAALIDRRLLQFDQGKQRWRWNTQHIEAQYITENVVELVASRINQLEPNTRRVVQLGACIGNYFDLQTLSLACNLTPREAAIALRPAIQEEILVPVGEAYKYAEGSVDSSQRAHTIWYRFGHDKLHQAAYSTVDKDHRPLLHEHVGQLIMAETRDGQFEERIFEIINHLNLAPSRESRVVELANLNLMAGNKAKSSTAYLEALHYFTTGANMLGESGWQHHYELTFDLHLQKLITTYMSGLFAESETLAYELVGHARNTLDEVRIREQLIISHTSRLQFRKAIQAAVKALALLGETIPQSPSKSQLLLELGRTRLALRGRAPEELIELPEMTDPHMLAAMRIMLCASAPAYFEDANLMPYVALRMVRLSVKHGNAGHSAFGYVLYAGVLCGALKDMPTGLAYGRMALQLLDRYEARDIRGKVLQLFGSFVRHWSERISEVLPSFQEAASACLDAGDIEFHGYSRYSHLSYAYMDGMPLEQVWELLGQHFDGVRTHKHEKTQFIMQIMREALRELRGGAAPPRGEDDPVFDVASAVGSWQEVDKQAVAYYHMYHIVTCYMHRDYEACLQSAKYIRQHEHTVTGMLFSSYYLYFEALALTGLIPSQAGVRKLRALRRVRHIANSMLAFSRHAPEYYRHKYLLVTAELHRVTGESDSAEQLYTRAIKLARRSTSLHDEALACELLAEFHADKGRQTVSAIYLAEAIQTYRRWGAQGWIEQIRSRHSALLSNYTQTSPLILDTADSHATKGDLNIDVAAITRTSRAISEQIVLDDVLRVVLDAAIVNAGATRGVLLLTQEEDIILKAVSDGATGEIQLDSVSMTDSSQVPHGVINYVSSSGESIVVDSVPTDPTFSVDPYFNERHARSIIALPLVEKGQQVGFLYLENSLVYGAFTRERIKILEVLAAQAAISIVNARLYSEVSDHAEALELKVEERTEKLSDAYAMLRDIFGKYVPQRIVEDLVAGKGSLKPTKTVATILYSDIEGFTSIAEKIPPEQVVTILNEYFPAVIEPIERNGGVVNQFQGDAMLVTFNVPLADSDHASNAIQTAIEIQQLTANRTFGGVSLRTRIGINTGEVIAGNVGSGDRINYTVHGDAVNIAARIEQLNKDYGTLALVSSNTVDLVESRHGLKPVGETKIRGKAAPVMLYHVTEDACQRSEAALARRFQSLWNDCAIGTTDATAAWEMLLTHYTEDHRRYHTLEHLQHCLEQFDRATELIESPRATELALWFHDIICDLRIDDNERRSAELFRQLASPCMEASFINQVCRFIMATTHNAPEHDIQAAFTVDIDLSSLGLNWESYLKDSEALRQEACDLPDDAYYAKQLAFLEGLTERPRMFQTPYFSQLMEDRARGNIERYSQLIQSQLDSSRH
jgi:predicted ATPase/class 3 adenylate cyclase/predicted metal-dependent HD superfamily phosphohydrolase